MIFSLIRRLLQTLITLFILSGVSYLILMQDPLNSPLAQPYFYSGYIDYIGRLLNGDLGISYNGGESLTNLIATVLPPTLELCFLAILLAFIFGISFGLIGAVYQRYWLGKTIRAISSLGLSIPIFWLAPILLYFAATLGWEISAVGQINLLYDLPSITGFAIIDVWFVDKDYQIKMVQSVLQHLALPTLVLSISPTMEITRLIQQRAEFIFSQNFAKVAKTRGWSKLKVLRKYVLRNSLPLLVPQLTGIFTLVLAQSMLIENTFGWPGIGRWLIDSVAQQDYNSISAAVIAIGILIILVNMINELLSFFLDPTNKKGWYVR